MTDHGQIVGDEHIGEPLVPLQFLQQIQNLGLDGYVQGGDRLVTYHEIRVQRKCTGDADPLAAPAIQLMGVGVGHVGRDAHSVHQFLDPALLLVPGPADSEYPQGFGNQLRRT